MMPGLRIGFLAAPAAIGRSILQAKHITDISSSGLIQRAFDYYLKTERWKEHLESMRQLFAGRCRAVLRSADNFLSDGGFTWRPPSGGLNLWLTLPKNISAAALYGKAARKGVLITPGNVFKAGLHSYDSNIRISIAAASEQEIPLGISILAESAANLLKNRTDSPVMHPLM
jgi:DNA-binding transcriptional MocR family regulator